MKRGWLLRVCMLLAVGVGLVSCTKEEINQAMNRPAEILQSSRPCTPAGVSSTSAPEFCVNLMEIQLLNQDTAVDVSLTLVNRTDRRIQIGLKGAYLTDSSGQTWAKSRSSGLGSTDSSSAASIDPNVENQGSILFHKSNAQSSADLTFSLRGEIVIWRVDSRGQPIFKTPFAAQRAVNISGIRIPQKPPQSSGPTDQNPGTELAAPKASASSQSSPFKEVAGVSESGKPNSPRPASPNANSSSDQRLGAIPIPVGQTPISNSESSAGAGPDVVGLRIGMTSDMARTIFKSRVLVSDSLRKYYKETPMTLAITLPSGGSGGPVPNGNFLSRIGTAGEQEDLSKRLFFVLFAPVPGHESIVAVDREEGIRGDKKPTFDAFEKTLLDKYGTPTQSDPVNGSSAVFQYYWSYDSNGTLRKPGSIKDISYCSDKAAGGGTDRTNTWILFWLPREAELKQLPAQCGDIFLRVYGRFDGNKFRGRETLVDLYQLSMVGFDASIRAIEEARVLINKASADASAAAIKKGQQQKPDF